MNPNQEDENHMNRLPDCLLLLILNKILDAKTLIRCSSLSKRFASLVPQTDTVFLPIKPFQSQTTNLLSILTNFFKKAPIPCCQDQAPYPALINLKNNFPDVKSLHIHLHAPIKSDGGDLFDCLVKWKAVCGAHFETCVTLFATSFDKTERIIGAIGDSSENSDQGLLSQRELVFVLDSIKNCLKNVIFRHHLVAHLVSDHKKLKKILFSDSKRQGKLCMGGDEIEELRERGVHLRREVKVGPFPVKLWYVPVLDLRPSCGYVMEEVVLAVIRNVDQEIVMERDVGLILGAFDEEGELGRVYDEAVMAILNRNDKEMYQMDIPDQVFSFF